jgi:hypothetical protein
VREDRTRAHRHSADPVLQGLRECVPSLPLPRVPIPTARAVFIAEVTARAFLNADACKRRTVNKSDVARALARSDMFDFLIDIVPREDTGQPGVKRKNTVEHAVRRCLVRASSAHSPRLPVQPTLPPAQRVHEQYHPPNMPMGALLHQSAAEKHETATPALGSPMALEQVRTLLFFLPHPHHVRRIAVHAPDGAGLADVRAVGYGRAFLARTR